MQAGPACAELWTELQHLRETRLSTDHLEHWKRLTYWGTGDGMEHHTRVGKKCPESQKPSLLISLSLAWNSPHRRGCPASELQKSTHLCLSSKEAITPSLFMWVLEQVLWQMNHLPRPAKPLFYLGKVFQWVWHSLALAKQTGLNLCLQISTQRQYPGAHSQKPYGIQVCAHTVSTLSSWRLHPSWEDGWEIHEIREIFSDTRSMKKIKPDRASVWLCRREPQINKDGKHSLCVNVLFG